MNDMTHLDTFDTRADRAAANILAMLHAPYSNASVLAALRLAYANGARDHQAGLLEEMIRRDDELQERT